MGYYLQRNVYLNSEVSPESVRVIDEQRVDQAEQLHDALVLPQVLVALEQEHVLLAVGALDGEFAGPLLRGYHLQRRLDIGDAHRHLVGTVGAGHGQFQVLTQKQLRGHVVQLEARQLRQLS